MIPDRENIASAIRETLVSPNESDRNFETANVVDGLFVIARALDNIARAIRDAAASQVKNVDG